MIGLADGRYGILSINQVDKYLKISKVGYKSYEPAFLTTQLILDDESDKVSFGDISFKIGKEDISTCNTFMNPEYDIDSIIIPKKPDLIFIVYKNRSHKNTKPVCFAFPPMVDNVKEKNKMIKRSQKKNIKLYQGK